MVMKYCKEDIFRRKYIGKLFTLDLNTVFEKMYFYIPGFLKILDFCLAFDLRFPECSHLYIRPLKSQWTFVPDLKKSPQGVPEIDVTNKHKVTVTLSFDHHFIWPN